VLSLFIILPNVFLYKKIKLIRPTGSIQFINQNKPDQTWLV
jgi:hypothetical protein